MEVTVDEVVVTEVTVEAAVVVVEGMGAADTGAAVTDRVVLCRFTPRNTTWKIITIIIIIILLLRDYFQQLDPMFLLAGNPEIQVCI
jgi:hypothetical protein